MRLHYAGITSSGEPTTDEHNNPLLSLTGSGPEVHLDVFGTGFLASTGGQILTNHHVAEPWWQNDDLKELLDQGLEPVIADMTAYFPGVTHGIGINTEKISSAADVAVVKGNVSGLGIKQIALADGRRAAVSGGPVVLLGYPTALDAILARAGAETLQSIATASIRSTCWKCPPRPEVPQYGVAVDNGISQLLPSGPPSAVTTLPTPALSVLLSPFFSKAKPALSSESRTAPE